jgi:hypothetical protein
MTKPSLCAMMKCSIIFTGVTRNPGRGMPDYRKLIFGGEAYA